MYIHILQEQEIIRQILDDDIHAKIIVSTRSDDNEESALEDMAPFDEDGVNNATNEGNAPVTAAAEVNHAASAATGPVSVTAEGKTVQVDEDAVRARLSNKDVKLSAEEWDAQDSDEG